MNKAVGIRFAMIAVLMMAATLSMGTLQYVGGPYPSEVDVTYGVPYGTAPVNPEERGPGTVELTLDTYVPRPKLLSNKSAVVAIHGGAFTGGTSRDLSGICMELAKRGYVCFSIEYRLLGVNPPEGRDAGIADAQKAVQWIRKHAADYGIDPNRIAALGHSAGGYIATGLGVADSELCSEGKGVDDPFHTSGYSFRVQAAVNLSAGVARAEDFDPSDSPMLIVHGTSDPVVPIAAAEALRDACETHAIPHRYVPLEGVGHDPWNIHGDGQSLADIVADFLATHLADQTPPAQAAPENNQAAEPVHTQEQAPLETATDSSTAPDAGPFTLDTSATEHGTATLTPPGGTYAAGTEVSLTPKPDSGYLFGYWLGDIRASGPEARVVMDRNRKIRAVFTLDPTAPRLSLQIGTEGEGQVRTEPEPPQNEPRFLAGSSVHIEAIPEPGWIFSRWNGSFAGQGASLDVVMDETKTATAVFNNIIQVSPKNFELPQPGGEEMIDFHFSGRSTDDSSGYRFDWVQPWAQVERVSGQEQILIRAEANTTPYPRMVRLAFFDVNTRPVHVYGIQPGIKSEPKSSEAGTALYTGLPGEWGTLAWHEPSIPREHLVLESNGDGSLAVGCFQGAQTGYLSVDGEKPLQIPDGEHGYDLYAAWELPENPLEFVNPDNPADARPSYFYIGVDSGGVDFTKLRFGVEWKDMGKGAEWVLRGQRHLKEIPAASVNAGKPPRHVEVHIWRDPAGGQGKAAIFAQFRLDSGPWQDFVSEWDTNYIPIEALAYDLGDDMITFKSRGLSTRMLHGLRVVGKNVPGVNLGLDSNRDDTDKYNEMLRGTPALPNPQGPPDPDAMKNGGGGGIRTHGTTK